ncbi:MAG TPA: serine/threonine-protein kinase [Kofleriaceae bacterium]
MEPGKDEDVTVALGPAPPRDDQPPPLPFQVRDQQRYHFFGEHGRGGLGRVSRVRDRELGRDVAIKELLSRGSADEPRFLREVLITSRLEHPGIVPVHDAGRWAQGTPFYAMKLVAGRPLRELIAERARVEDRIGLLHHVIAVADAMAYAHGRNIIHRDLKPANVVVGEFGETVVIDWGLAKDLSSSEPAGIESAPSGPSPSPSPGDDLTVAGAVLGTPAYMAPEQKRGEPVDKRADVFAIGMMLWELCAPQRIPPGEAHLRHRMLRRAGIDEDLATITEKALDPDPERRYPDAGALAADLKAFKAGARIAARSYSLLAMLTHWTRRHRALALATAAAAAVAVAGTALYVRNIATERDRADASQASAERARASAERARASAQATLDEFTLKHAELLLATDPSAAVDALATYHGTDLDRAAQIRAEAAGRGVAVLRALPHSENVRWIQGVPNGEILSLSHDGTIARTSRDGRSTVVARNVSRSGIWAYAQSRHLLAYACNPSALCLLDALRAALIPTAAPLRDANIDGLDFSPSGNLLGMMSHDAVLRVFDVTDPARPALRLTRPIAGGYDVVFISDDIAVAGAPNGIEFIRMNGTSERYSLPGFWRWAAGRTEHQIALTTKQGEAVILDSFPARVVARTTLCHGPTAQLQFIPGRQSIAYACHDGALGTWDLQHGTVRPRAQLEGHADFIADGATGDYVIAAGGNGIITVLDLETDLIASYRGHGVRLTWLASPTPEQPFIISGDVRGAIRVWPLPARLARVAATSRSPFYRAIFDEHSAMVTATTLLPALTTFSPATGVRAVEPHLSDNIFLERSASGRTFATYGVNDLVEVWSAASMTRARVIPTGHGSVTQLRFVDDTDDFITSGHDGRVVRWTPSGQPTLLVESSAPIDRFATTRTAGSILFSTVDGALWRAGGDGHVFSLRIGGSRVSRLLTLPDQQTAIAGYANGDVVEIDTRSWQQVIVLHGSGPVGDIAVTGDGRTVAVATNDGAIHVGTRRAASGPEPPTWLTLAGRANHVALALDLVMASCTDGTIWLYSLARRRWLYLPTGTVDISQIAVIADGKAAVALDREGRLLWMDLEAARKLLDT